MKGVTRICTQATETDYRNATFDFIMLGALGDNRCHPKDMMKKLPRSM